MALNVSQVIKEVHDHLTSNIAIPVYKQGVPDAEKLPRDGSGKVPYYIAIQYGTPWHKASGRTFSGVRHDDYLLPITAQVVGPDIDNVEAIALDGVMDVLLGFTTEWSSQMEQRAGGSVVPMTQSTAATEAYMFPLGFGLTFQMDPS